MLEFVQNASVLELWQWSLLMPSTMTPFCTYCACTLFAKPHLACPVQICVPCPIYCCSMHLFNQAHPGVKLASRQHASSWLLLCYSYQAGSMLCISHQYDSMLCIMHQYSSVLWIRHQYGSTIATNMFASMFATIVQPGV